MKICVNNNKTKVNNNLPLFDDYTNASIYGNNSIVMNEYDDDFQTSPEIDSKITYDDYDDSEFIYIPNEENTSIYDSDIDKNIDVPSPPKYGDASGLSDVIINLIKGAYNSVQEYNSALATIQSISADVENSENSPQKDLYNIISDLVNDVNLHIGKLQGALKVFSPNAQTIEQGVDEVEKQITSTDSEVLHPFMQVQTFEQPKLNTNKFETEQETNDISDECSLCDIDDTF